MKTQILEQADNQRQKLEAEIEQLKTQMNSYTILLRKVAMIYGKLEQELNKLGLIIDTYYVPNFNARNSMGEVMEYENISMEINAVKNETNKFRFITFAGYDSRGAGKNRAQLNNKAEVLGTKLAEAIKCQVRINPYSLEINKPSSRGRVLLHVKIER